MRAYVITGPGEGAVQDVEAPAATAGNVVIDVERVGVCGTDAAFYSGQMPFLHNGLAEYPLRLGHEWSGTVTAVGEGADAALLGRRVTGDTMLGCGTCRRCLGGHQHVCEFRFEVGVRGGFPGALAEQLAMPARAIHPLPDELDPDLGALVEPGGNALRAVWGAALTEGDRTLVLGAGTIGLLAAMFARAQGAEVHLMGRSERSLEFARTLGFDGVWTADELPDLPFGAVIDASNGPALPAKALELVEPAGRVVYIGLASTPSLVDTRNLTLKDVTAVGVLSGSPSMSAAIDLFAAGAIDPRPLIGATVGLSAVGAVLSGERPADAGPGPKMLVDPQSA
ncbi:alcohol dehydrogenase catalytic domain-containing protein [Herbiconiux sp.]|uniref:zinc-dependent alcohol dehydrogenase n=1 Tax=Herbiconiux sp. TaxID=1871186 RepID=UPI0025B90AC8|nr:alcohol dehydrogenase catalytic domain-containing protein [Herbiconiux sp.]